MRKRTLRVLFLFALLPMLCAARSENADQNTSEYRGWDYLVQQLRALGVDNDTLKKVYGDPRMPEYGPIPFAAQPRETSAAYAGFLSRHNLELAAQFMDAHGATLNAVRSKYGVDPAVITSILLVESRFGANTGHEIILNRLSRLAALGTPENIEFNYQRLIKDDPKVTRVKLHERAEYLQKTFIAEIPVLFTIARQESLDPLTLRGSTAGALGMPQFLPSSYVHYAVDGNGDGAISISDPDDAIASTANFLKSAGWKNNLPLTEKRKVIWKYNKSDQYITTVLKISRELPQRTSIVRVSGTTKTASATN